MEIREAIYEELPELLRIQKLAFTSEAELHNDFDIQPMTETLNEVEDEFLKQVKQFLVIEDDKKIVGGVRVEIKENICDIQKMLIHPDYQRKGIGSLLMKEVERRYPNVLKYELHTAERSERNVNFYKKLGYKISGTGQYKDHIHKVYMEKMNKRELEEK